MKGIFTHEIIMPSPYLKEISSVKAKHDKY